MAVSTSTERNPYVWNLSAAVAAVFLKQAYVGFPLTNPSSPSKLVTISPNAGKTGLGLNLVSPLGVDYWTWEYVGWPMLVELNGRTDLPSLYAANGVKMAEYLYPLLYSRLATLGKVPS